MESTTLNGYIGLLWSLVGNIVGKMGTFYYLLALSREYGNVAYWDYIGFSSNNFETKLGGQH